MRDPLELHHRMDPPFERFDNSMLGEEFPAELETVSRFWFACGYRPGIAAYLNFFLLSDFIVTHDTAFPPRFRSFRSMAESFYQTDLFIRDLSDSGRKPTGGISSGAVREMLRKIMKRHQRIAIPGWMMTYFGFSLLEMVEKQCGPLTHEEKRLHLGYMTKAYRIMGMLFSADRMLMEKFGRSVEAAHAGDSPALERHARDILLLGEMIGVASGGVAEMLPPPTRAAFGRIEARVRPGVFGRVSARLLGQVLMKQAVGTHRKPVPVSA